MHPALVRLVCLGTLFISTSVPAARPRPAPAVQSVTLEQVLEAPEVLHGKRLRFTAWLSMGQENRSLCPGSDTLSPRHCLWLDIHGGPVRTDKDQEREQRRLPQWQACAGRMVTIVGTLDAMDQGLLGQWAATLKDVSSVQGDGCTLNPRQP